MRPAVAPDAVFYAWCKRLGSAIRTRRRADGLTLKDLARRTGLAIGTIGQIETAVTAPSIHSLLVLAQALRVRLVDLLPDIVPPS